MLLHRTCLALRSSSHVRQRFAVTAALNTSYAFRPSSSSASSDFVSMDIRDLRDVCVVRGLDDSGNEEALRRRLTRDVARSIKLIKEVRPKDANGYQSATRALERGRALERAASTKTKLAEIRSKKSKSKEESKVADVSIRSPPSTSQSSASTKSKSLNKDPWQQRYRLLLDYKSREGHCMAPRNHIEGGIKLGRWVDNQRQIYKKGKLPKNRVDLMNELGFSWDPLSEAWEEKFSLLKQFKERKGNCLVPSRHIEGGTKLGIWVKEQRYMYKKGKLPQSRVDLLNEIGFSWDPLGEQWESNFSLLKQYEEREGNCLVPLKHIERGIKLGIWVRTERELFKKGKMPKRQVDMMNELGFSWDPFSEQWEEKFLLMKQYKKREGNCLVPSRHIERGIKLGRWVDAQRNNYKKGKMPKSKVDMMNEIGFSWDPLDEAWEETFSLLKQFKEREGHCNLKSLYKEGDINLGIWLQNQKQARKRGTLSEERFQRLQELGAPMEK